MGVRSLWKRFWEWVSDQDVVVVYTYPAPRRNIDDIVTEAERAMDTATRAERVRFAALLGELEEIERRAFEAFLDSPADEYRIWSEAEADMAQLVERSRRTRLLR